MQRETMTKSIDTKVRLPKITVWSAATYGCEGRSRTLKESDSSLRINGHFQVNLLMTGREIHFFQTQSVFNAVIEDYGVRIMHRRLLLR